MYGYIYKFTNNINGKIYIGKHKYNLPKLDENYLASGLLINKAFQKYGLENFTQEIITFCDSLEDLNLKEKFYIKQFNCMSPNGYNLTTGGDGISDPTEEIINRNRQWHIGKKQSEETIRKRMEGTRKTISLKSEEEKREWYRKVSEANKGQIISKEQRELSSKRHKNTHWYNDGINEFMLFDEDVTPNLIKGRLKNPFGDQANKNRPHSIYVKIGKALSGSIWYNNGEKEIMLKSIKDVPEGYIKGRLKKNKNIQ